MFTCVLETAPNAQSFCPLYVKIKVAVGRIFTASIRVHAAMGTARGSGRKREQHASVRILLGTAVSPITMPRD